jgi:nitroreductase / dihydropteridine reductase
VYWQAKLKKAKAKEVDMSAKSIEYLNWRYATKKFDPTKKVSEQELNELLEVARFSPSSFGLQPWKFLVLTDPQTRNKIKPLAWNQPQITDSSFLVIFCSLASIDERFVKKFVKSISTVRGIPVASLAEYEKMMVDFVKGHDQAWLSNWMKRQVYIALGMLLSECARREIDACPMEGFDPAKIDEALGLAKENLNSVVMCAVGYRAPSDEFATFKKVRFEPSEVIRRI